MSSDPDLARYYRRPQTYSTLPTRECRLLKVPSPVMRQDRMVPEVQGKNGKCKRRGFRDGAEQAKIFKLE
jgi:hypothetical protein